MELMKFNIKNNEYQFVNESFSNSRNWGHKTKLFKNGSEISDHKSIYYNRTWESYQYQSCMRGSVYTLIDIEFADIISKYKIAYNIKRMASTLKQELRDKFESHNELFSLLKKL